MVGIDAYKDDEPRYTFDEWLNVKVPPYKPESAGKTLRTLEEDAIIAKTRQLGFTQSYIEIMGKMMGDALRRREDCEIVGKLDNLMGKPFICTCTEAEKK